MIDSTTRPSAANDVYQFIAGDGADPYASRGNRLVTMEAVGSIFDWFTHLGIYQDFAGEVVTTFSTLGKTYAPLGLLSGANNLRNLCFYANPKSDEQKTEYKEKIAGSALGVIKDVGKSVLWLDAVGAIAFGAVALVRARATFWVGLGLIEVLSAASSVKETIDLTSQLAVEKASGNKNQNLEQLLKSKIHLSYLHVVKSVSIVAMASISLISIVFGAMAKGFIFSSPVMLGLSTAWLVLNIATHFYGLSIERWHPEPLVRA